MFTIRIKSVYAYFSLSLGNNNLDVKRFIRMAYFDFETIDMEGNYLVPVDYLRSSN